MSAGHGPWWIGFIGSAITAVTFIAVGVALARSLNKTQQWRQNPLGVGTMLIFITCGVGHLIHTLQLLYLDIAGPAAIGEAARIHYGEWHLWIADGATAAAGTWYWLSRRAFPNLVSGAALYENVRRQQRRAVEIHDNVVQGLVKAAWHLDLDDPGGSKRALRATLDASERMKAEIEQTAQDTRGEA